MVSKLLALVRRKVLAVGLPAADPELVDPLRTFEETFEAQSSIFAGRLSQRRKRERRKGFEPSTPSLGSSFAEVPPMSREGCDRPSTSKSDGLKHPGSPTDDA